MKKVKKYSVVPFCFLIFIAFLKIILPNNIYLFDLINNTKENEFVLKIPFLQIVLEPFVGPLKYISIFYRDARNFIFYIPVCILIFLLFFKKIIRAIILFLLSAFLSVYFFNYLFQYKIFRPEKFILVDFHSHTSFSHDGYTTVQKSIKWHIYGGYDIFSITDHNKVMGAILAKELFENKVIVGKEINDDLGNHLLIYSENAALLNLEGLNIKKMCELVHSKHGLVFVTHPWKKDFRYFEDVDGFEIYSKERIDPKIQDIEKLVKYCKKKKLAMIGGTNWHGYGFSDVWTVVKTDHQPSMKNRVLEILKKREIEKVKVLVLRSGGEELHPLFFLFFYFSSLDFLQIFSWFCWLFFRNFI